MASLQSGLGEASILALSSRYEDPTQCLTMWSSGTGGAGVFGFAWVYLLNTLWGWSFAATLAAANLLTACFGAIFFVMLPPPAGSSESGDDSSAGEAAVDDSANLLTPSSEGPAGKAPPGAEPAPSTVKARFLFARTLWPYMVPLFLVYFAEYAMQSGTWAAIGFPVTDEESRKAFYQKANWVYQGGVFVSRR